ncbi:prohead protease/major capsid protein fusion protein [Kaistia sp. MMO-174]|uniref:prohead protease/major capsid protein fusion protein n=1 Tax=Kaistia sp. MMO-174 TaxID=3081256 RepID=UPI00301AB02D
MPQNTVNVPPQRRGAEFRAESFNEADNTIEVVFTTGATVRRYSWWDGEYNEELVVDTGSVRLERLNAGAPFLNTHGSWDLSDVIGSVVPGSARIEGGQGIARILLSQAPGDADNVQKIRDGIIRNVSVGYRLHKVEKTEADDGTLAHWRVVDWEPFEISAVPVPADPGAQVRSADEQQRAEAQPCIVIRADAPPAAQSAPKKETAMANRTNAAAEEARGNETTVDTRTPAPAPASTAAPAPSADVDAQIRRAVEDAARAERTRIDTIRTLAAKVGRPDFADAHVRTDTTVEAFRVLLIDEIADQQERGGNPTSHARVEAQADEMEKRGAAIESALLHRSDPRTFELSAAGRDFRGYTLLEIGRECLERAGVRTRGLSKLEVAQRALELRSGGMMSTSDFPGILANVATKTLRAAYEAAPQTFRPLVRETSVSDFKQVSRTQLGDAPGFEKVNEHGEFKRGSIGEGVEKYAVETYGRIVAITRQVIVNDDLEAFSRLPRQFGVQAANLESDLVWAQILGAYAMGDGKALFHADHGNLAGTNAAITVDSIGVGRLGMSKQTGIDGTTLLNIDPQYLVVPKSLQTKAEQFVGQIWAAKTADQVPESLRSLTIIAEPRLDVGIPKLGIAGSATAWYLAAAISQIDLVELAYLEGQRGVFTETRQGFDVDGVEIKVRLDVGAKAIDWRGFFKNAGA